MPASLNDLAKMAKGGGEGGGEGGGQNGHFGGGKKRGVKNRQKWPNSNEERGGGKSAKYHFGGVF